MQPLKCIPQNNHLDLWLYTLYIIWQGVHLLVKLQAGELINKLLKWNLSQVLLKTLANAPKVHYRASIVEEPLPMTASPLKYDHDVIIIKSAKSWKLNWYEEVAGNK